MLNYRKIYQNSETAQNRILLFSNDEKLTLNNFLEYLKFEYPSTNKNGQLNGTPSSYRVYLIKLNILLYENQPEYQTLDSMRFLNDLYQLQHDPRFKEYNDSEKGFPNATIEAFKRFTNLLFLELYDSNDTGDRKIITSEFIMEKYSRSQKIKQEALELVNWKCEINPEHRSFAQDGVDHDYMEGHHFIPLSQQFVFDDPLDISENIVCLCPNCHRKIHYGKKDDKTEMITVLLKLRKNRHELFQKIDLKDLKTMYSID